MTNTPVCDFCGRDKLAVSSMVCDPMGKHCICKDCVKDVLEVMGEKIADTDVTQEDIQNALATASKEAVKTNIKLTPKLVKEHLDQYVISQDEAKKVISVAVYNHYKRINNLHQGDVEITKSNIMMVGPTGSGKTLIGQTIARILDVPFAIADATSLTQSGYVGDDVETILQRLISAASDDIEKASRGIILIDEIDKISKCDAGAKNTLDVGGQGVQQALLKIIEGTVARVPQDGGRKHPNGSMNTIDTKNILFICCGAFVGLDKIREERLKNKHNASIGFTFSGYDEKHELQNKATQFTNRKYSAEDIVKFGFIPEFMGRVPIVVNLEELDFENLKKIVTEPKNSILKQYEALFAVDGIKLTMTEKALNQIVELAINEKTGARGLRSILESVLTDVMFEMPEPGVTEVVIEDIFTNEKIRKVYETQEKAA